MSLRRLVLIAVLLFVGVAGGRPVYALPPGSTPREIELGQQAAADIAKAFQFLQDEEQLAKLQGMLDEIALATERPAIRYRPHIVVTPAINAFVIPGGDVYVTTGLLTAVPWRSGEPALRCWVRAPTSCIRPSTAICTTPCWTPAARW